MAYLVISGSWLHPPLVIDQGGLHPPQGIRADIDITEKNGACGGLFFRISRLGPNPKFFDIN